MKRITLVLLGCLFSGGVFAQFTEDFDADTTLPAGWSVIQGGDAANTWQVTDMMDYIGLDAHSGTNAAIIEYDTDEAHDDYLVTPAITVTAGLNDYFSFWGRSLDPGYPEMVDVLLSTTGANAADFMVTLQANVAPPGGEDYYKFSYDLSDYVGQTVYIAFHSTTTNEFIFEVDDVVSTALPSCLEPTAMTASNITDTSADVSWASAGNNFEIEYGPEGFIQGTGIMATSTTPSVSLSNLDQNTVYDVYVRQNCGANGFSEYALFSFMTIETPAVNDECSGAVELFPGVDFDGGVLDSTNLGATSSSDLPSCQASATRDVWFKVVVPADGNLTLETALATDSENDDTVMIAYTGTCGNLTEIDCNDDNTADNSLFSKLELTGLTAGETIYVAVWQYDSDFFGSTPGAFRMSAYNTPLAVGNQDVNAFKYYPNPVKDKLNLSYDQSITSVAVTNMFGQQVLAKNINASATELDLSALAQGTYVVKVNTADAVKVVKVVKQ
ncbi:T9SS-dependent choice-of-anchor J family protein [Flavobacterium pallidum]|uniref:Fibronectin type-III domain-containing protein n=1 Tax=Flavobacterium pallidum TaxID=2172098 RepID=A0A2S1SDK8_9FLAO|nr:choice-of-anchor J domain-containing protein [Flavobacterium pallidum]AWI24480.1 hypothetical protein HYN49_00450 [Flavobacterium pallidum]